MGEKKEGTITVFNTGAQRFLIKAGPKNKDNEYLEPGQAMEVSQELGEKLLKYNGIKDASKMVKGKSDDHEKTIKDLEAKIVKLEEKIKDLLEDGKKKK